MVTAHTSEPPATPWYRKPRGILLLHAGRCILSAYLIGPIAAFACHGLESSALGSDVASRRGLMFR